jgi:hypothetical protein
MNITSPILNGAAQAAAMPGDSVASFLKMIGGGLGLFADDGPDGSLGLLMSGLSGVAAGLAVAIFLTIYFRTGYRSLRDMIKHGLAAAAVLGLLAFVAYDMRHAALAYLGINASNPASLKSACRRRRYPMSLAPRSNCTPTKTRRSPGCRARSRLTAMAAACSGVRSRSTIAPPTASWC